MCVVSMVGERVGIYPTISEAESNRLKSDLTSIRLDMARLRAALSASDDPLANFQPPEDASPARI